MGIFKGIYNWLAQRNSGQAVGMQWEPSMDTGRLQRSKENSDNMAAEDALQLRLPDAQQFIATGNYETAHKRVNRVLLELPLNSNSPLVKQARNEAQRILAITSAHVQEPEPDKSSNDCFNAANALASNETGSSEYRANLGEVIKLCQLAIRKDITNGDAYVLLADAYFLLAVNGGSKELYDFCIGKALAVIDRWKSDQMYTRNRGYRDKVFQLIVTYLAGTGTPYPSLIWEAVFQGEYTLATNIDDFYGLEDLLNKNR